MSVAGDRVIGEPAQVGLPLYRRIARELEQEIARALAPGQQVAPEHALAERFSVNRHTVRRAVDVLSDAGLLVRRHGLGTYVTEPRIDYSIGGRTRFTENVEAAGRRPQSRILRRELQRASAAVAEKLSLRTGERIICIEALRLADDRPLCITTMHLPATLAPTALTNYRRGSLHAFLEKNCGFSPRRRGSVISSSLPVASDAVALQMPANQPVLRVESVNVHPQTGRAVEYSISRFRADRLELHIALDGSGEPDGRELERKRGRS